MTILSGSPLIKFAKTCLSREELFTRTDHFLQPSEMIADTQIDTFPLLPMAVCLLISEISSHNTNVHPEDMKRIKTWMKATMSSMPPDRLKGLSQKGAATFVTRLIAQPHLFKQFCEECTAQISSTMAWNDRRLSTAKETIMRANQLLRRISADGDIQNKLPFLRNIPDWVPDFLQPWKVAEKVRFQRERNFWFGEKEEVRKSLLNEKPDASWMARHLSMPTTPKFEEDNTYSIGMLALIGSILTSSPIQSFFHAMIVSPEWQAKGQEEVDRVCGDRPPSVDDIQQLPVVRAIIREIFRWRSPAPAGMCDPYFPSPPFFPYQFTFPGFETIHKMT